MQIQDDNKCVVIHMSVLYIMYIFNIFSLMQSWYNILYTLKKGFYELK